MDFDRLRLFKDVAHSRSISKGAGMHGISQSAVSQYLHDLEEQMGMALLDRGSRPLTVTEAGKLYLDMCRDILSRRDEFQLALDVLKGEVEGTVRVASI
jgi:DNA-binding transcriptional LysR family regulator